MPDRPGKHYEFPGPHSVHRHFGVVSDRFKLVRFYEPAIDSWELFDFKTHPREMRSVYDDPTYAPVRMELLEELARLRKELKVPDPDPAETAIKR